jgi:hypothetical protein
MGPRNQRPQLLSVHLLGDNCAAVTDEPGNLLDRDAAVRQQRDERVPKIAWRLVGRVNAVDLGRDGAELSADVV